MLFQRRHLGPVGDVRPHGEGMLRVGVIASIEDLPSIDARIEPVTTILIDHLQLRGRGEPAAVSDGGCDGPGVHQTDGGHLALPGLGPLPVRIVARDVADRQLAVGGRIRDAKAGTADAGTKGDAAERQVPGHALGHEIGHDGQAAGVDPQLCPAAGHRIALQDVAYGADVFKHPSGAAGDERLIHCQFSVLNVI